MIKRGPRLGGKQKLGFSKKKRAAALNGSLPRSRVCGPRHGFRGPRHARDFLPRNFYTGRGIVHVEPRPASSIFGILGFNDEKGREEKVRTKGGKCWVLEAGA